MSRITLTLPSPYVGLRPFDEADALLFFGRDLHVRDLLAKLRRHERFVAVLGASGTGKSSLIRAGLIPALRGGALRTPQLQSGTEVALDRWTACVFTPGDAPLARMARALACDPRWVDGTDRDAAEASLAALLGSSPLALASLYRQRAARFPNEALMLVVDQFEEIFRYRQANIDEADGFVKLLLRSAKEDVPIYVVTTMRSDFLGQAVTVRGLAEAINEGLYLVPRPDLESVRSAICSPLGLVGGGIDPRLANLLLNMLTGDDELPVLQHALRQMWTRARQEGRDTIEQKDFEVVCSLRADAASGDSVRSAPAVGLVYAIDNHAEAIHATLPVAQQIVARRVFLSLAERRGGRDVRRPQTLAELVAQVGSHRRPDVLSVLEAFRAGEAGFIQPAPSTSLVDETTIDISHESLIRQWRRFQRWLADEESDVSGLREWHLRALRHAEDGAGLLDERDCERLSRWRDRVFDGRDHVLWLSRFVSDSSIAAADVVAYLDSSLAADAARRRRRAGVRRFRLSAFIALPLVAYLVTPLLGGPPPPKRIVFAVQNTLSDDHHYAEQLAVAARRAGITVDLQVAGDAGTLERMMSTSPPAADLAFVRAGRYDIRQGAVPELQSLGNMYLKPLWIFYREGQPMNSLADLQGRTIGMVESDTDAEAIAPRLLELDAMARNSAEIVFGSETPLIVKLLDGSVSALFINASPESRLVQMLLLTPGVSLFNDRKALYHASQLRDMAPVTMPAHIVRGKLPPQDTVLLAANMALVARNGLHPAVTSLLLGEAESVFRGKGLLHAAGSFPNGIASSDTELPLASAAADHYRSGTPLLMRYLPFWLATLLPRLLPALVVVFLVFLPLLAMAPRLFDLIERLSRWKRPPGAAKSLSTTQSASR